MASRRTLRAGQAIREVVAMAILKDLKDPRVKGVTVNSVEVAADMKSAKVYVSVLGTPAQETLAIKGLQCASGFLQQRCSERIDTRYTPRLRFVIDEGIKNLKAVTEILENEKRLREAENANAEQVSDEPDDESEDEADEIAEEADGNASDDTSDGAEGAGSSVRDNG